MLVIIYLVLWLLLFGRNDYFNSTIFYIVIFLVYLLFMPKDVSYFYGGKLIRVRMIVMKMLIMRIVLIDRVIITVQVVQFLSFARPGTRPEVIPYAWLRADQLGYF